MSKTKQLEKQQNHPKHFWH